MTGVTPRLIADASTSPPPDGTAIFMVGRTAATRSLIASGNLPDPAERKSEAYLVRSLPGQKPRQVVFLGGNGIATLYAVYHYLEECCGVGFYADGDHVPRCNLVPVSGIDISAAPWFQERWCMNLTLTWYSVPWWHWEDWQKYIDWLLKSRYNIMSLWDLTGTDAIWDKTWKQFGVDIADSSYSGPPYGGFTAVKYGVEPPLSAAWREGQHELERKIIQYARARGMRMFVPPVAGNVPPEFKRIHPDVPTFELSWMGFCKQNYLLPSGEMYHRVGKAFLEEYLSQFGTDHLYMLETYVEGGIGDVGRDILDANFKIVDEVDPQGIGFIETWSYKSGSPSAFRKMVEALPPERIRILDYWEKYPVYKKWDYLWGKPWHFGVVHSFANDTYMFGNMGLIERQFREIVQDPRANKCTGFSSQEETIGHNYFYFQFLAKLGWNPSEADLRSFTCKYAKERYGAAAATTMVPVLNELLASVYGYGSEDHNSPRLYWHRLTSNDVVTPRQAAAPAFVPPLRRALVGALRAKQLLADNPLYLHDLNDIARQYLSELFTIHLMAMNTAFEEDDSARFEQEAALVDRIMARIEELLSHDDYYWLTPFIRKARTLPGAPPDVDRRVRDILTLWTGKIVDYASRDYYETVQGYYRPRVQLYIQKLRQSRQIGQRLIGMLFVIEKEYEPIENNWVNNGFPLIERSPEPKRVISTVEKILQEF
jgi:alpha-N-acetylglucosaminidase